MFWHKQQTHFIWQILNSATIVRVWCTYANSKNKIYIYQWKMCIWSPIPPIVNHCGRHVINWAAHKKKKASVEMLVWARLVIDAIKRNTQGSFNKFTGNNFVRIFSTDILTKFGLGIFIRSSRFINGNENDEETYMDGCLWGFVPPRFFTHNNVYNGVLLILLRPWMVSFHVSKFRPKLFGFFSSEE